MTFPHKILRDLKPNWDSYGAPAIDERCIQKAYELWRQLSGEWQVVPCTDGGVQLEQHRDGFDIEITVSAARAEKETVPAPEASIIAAFARSPRRVQETVARRAPLPATGAPDCEKCGGAGWLRGSELDNPSNDTAADTMTRYSCDGEKCLAMRT